MVVKVLGPGCPKCKECEALVRKAAQQTDGDVEVEKVTDFKEIVALGVLATPAVVVDGEVKCTGRVPSEQEVLAWLEG